MAGNAYKVLGFVVWRGGMWYLRRRYGRTRRLGAGVLAVGAMAAAGALAARRRNAQAQA